MSDTEQFLDEVMPRIHEAETALHNGAAGPRFKMWSPTEPVTVFGAAFSPIGWAPPRSHVPEARVALLELLLVRMGSGCRRRGQGLRVSAGDRTDDRFGRRIRTDALTCFAPRRSSGALTASLR